MNADNEPLDRVAGDSRTQVSHGGAKSVNYVFGTELVEWCSARPNALTLIFDQSYSRGNEKRDMQRKLAFFEEHGVHGFAYSSHATLLLLCRDAALIKKARASLLEVSGLPPSRLVGRSKT